MVGAPRPHTLPGQTLLLGGQPCAGRLPESPLLPGLRNQGRGSPGLFQAEGLRRRLQQSQEGGFQHGSVPQTQRALRGPAAGGLEVSWVTRAHTRTAPPPLGASVRFPSAPGDISWAHQQEAGAWDKCGGPGLLRSPSPSSPEWYVCTLKSERCWGPGCPWEHLGEDQPVTGPHSLRQGAGLPGVQVHEPLLPQGDTPNVVPLCPVQLFVGRQRGEPCVPREEASWGRPLSKGLRQRRNEHQR